MTSDNSTEQLLSGDDILAAEDRTYDTVAVPEWRGSVRIQSMTAEEHVAFMDSNQDPEDKKTANVRAFVISAVDAAGNRLFTLKQVEALHKKNGRAFLRVVAAIKHINGWDDVAAKNA